MKLQALRDEAIVKLVIQEHQGLIKIPESATKFKQYDGEVFGEVLSVGPKHRLGVKSGDKIIFQRHEGQKIIYGRDKYLVVKEKWIMGVIKNG
jgi:co-chaperonin GroES (HSP10)